MGLRSPGPAAASGPIALALVWTGAVALMAMASILMFGPMVSALGCPDGCPGDPLLLRVARAALVIAAAYAAFAAIVVSLMIAARRTRIAAGGLGIVGVVLLTPTMLASTDLVRGEGDIGWPALLFVGIGVPGVLLLYAAWLVWRAALGAGANLS